jgi:hypothetical protein
MVAVTEISPELGIAPACEALGLARATFYRRRQLRLDERMVSRPQWPVMISISMDLHISRMRSINRTATSPKKTGLRYLVIQTK